MMADPLIWFKLPEHLITHILEQTTDLKTLKSWCEATRTISHLNRVALRLRWRIFTISKKSKTGCETKQAALIKGLVINSQSGNGGQMLTDIGNHQHILLTLKTILPHASCLEEVDHYGFLQQDLLDQLVSIPNLKALKLRSTHRYKLVQHAGTTSLALPINLDGLSCASKLTLLDVSHLLPREGGRLAKAVRCMEQLQHLRVADIVEHVLHIDEERSTPLAIFLNELCSKSIDLTEAASETSSDLSDLDDSSNTKTIHETNFGFPAMLKSLELVDKNQ